MKCRGLQRVIIVVRQLEESAKRYAELLGVPFAEAPGEGLGVNAMISEDWQIELISPVDDKSNVARYLAKHGEGVIGLAFLVDDIEEAKGHVQTTGFRILAELDFGQPAGWSSFKELILDPRGTAGAPITFVEARREL